MKYTIVLAALIGVLSVSDVAAIRLNADPAAAPEAAPAAAPVAEAKPVVPAGPAEPAAPAAPE